MAIYKIGILGIGGVGGYIGGKLALAYSNSTEVEILFIARGKNRDAIRENGIEVYTPEDNFKAYPKLVSDDANEIGKLDLLILATKDYDLPQALLACQDCIGPFTILLPLVNGVNTRERIAGLTRSENLLEGFCYMVSELVEPGLVRLYGKGHSIYLGYPGSKGQSLDQIMKIFAGAGINAVNPENIIKAAWEKYFFISSMATITSFLGKPIKEVAEVPANRELWQQLLEELSILAKAKSIPLDPGTAEKTLQKARLLPDDATTSMHRDMMKNKPTEVEALTGYVVKEARLLGLELPLYEKMYSRLKSFG